MKLTVAIGLLLTFEILATVLAQVTEENSTIFGDVSDQNYRIPPHLAPVHYKVRLQPMLEGNFTLKGHVNIDIKVLQSTDRIVLHMKDIITRNETVQVRPVGKAANIEILKQTFEPRREFYVIRLNQNLTEGSRINLDFDFIGYLNDDLNGLYRSSYLNAEGKQRWMAATQFQPTSARKAFPCYDEPALRATFDVALVRRLDMVAISNMPLKNTISEEPGWETDYFETTVPMSTYLLAFVVCDFESKNVPAGDGLHTELKLWARKELLHQTEFGSKIAKDSLVFLEEYFNLEFPLPKLDFVALPEMAPTAMENWGLILCRESGMLHEPGENSVPHAQWVTYIFAHELAHQWFGNLVTMEWWIDLWLNEGFATYVGYSVVDHLKPEWNTMEKFVVKTLQPVMQLDSLLSSPPVRVPVSNPEEIESVFGAVAYSKGASIIRMMSHFLTEKTLRKGLSNYLSGMKYKSAKQDDLWEYLTAQAHQDNIFHSDINIKNIMDTWTLKPGYPVVTLIRNETHMVFTQERFLQNYPQNYSSSDLWWVPVSWAQHGIKSFENTRPALWMSYKEHVLPMDDPDYLKNWMLVNPKQTGFYRVNYDLHSWQLLIKQLQQDHTQIHVINRAQIIDDAFNLARSGLLDYATALSTSSYLPKETEAIPWLAALNNVAYLKLMFRHTPSYGALQDYLLSVVIPIYDVLMEVDMEESSSESKVMKKDFISWACNLGYYKCVSMAQNLADQWRNDPGNYSIIPGDIADTMICTAVREGSIHDWNFFWNRYLECLNGDLKQSLAVALGCSKDVWILKRYLEAALDPETGVTLQDAATVYAAVASSPIGSLIAWNHLRENWLRIRDYVGGVMSSLSSLVNSATRHFNTKVLRDEIVEFEKTYRGTLGSAETTISQSIEKTEANVAWMETNEQTIISWLEGNGFSSRLHKL